MTISPQNGASHIDIKQHNLSAILMALLQDETLSRSILSEQLGISNATVTNLIAELQEQGIVAEGGEIKASLGRPQKTLHIIPEARYVVGVHLDVDTVNITLANLRGQQIDAISLPHMKDIPWEIVLAASTSAAEDLLERYHIEREKVIGVGVAASGLVDPTTGVNIIAPNMRWRDVPLKAYFEQHLQLPTVVDNNVRAMALYEALLGSAKDVQALAFVYTRIGIGAGLVVDRRLYRGANAGAGEIGHTTVILEGGEVCRCGNTGCLETLFSEPVLMRLAQQIAHEHPGGILAELFSTAESPTIDLVFLAAAQGDEVVQAMLKDRAQYIGLALANLVNVFNPEVILLGGIFSKERNTLLPTLSEIIKTRTFGMLGTQVELRTTTRGASIGMEGAATLALDRLFYRPI